MLVSPRGLHAAQIVVPQFGQAVQRALCTEFGPLDGASLVKELPLGEWQAFHGNQTSMAEQVRNISVTVGEVENECVQVDMRKS